MVHRAAPTAPSVTTTAGGGVAGRYGSSLHDTRNAALLGAALGIAFTTCFVTGLLSHQIQHPAEWFWWPNRPAGLYRVTQGLHVATGLASIPLLLAKLWVVAPRFWARPAVPDLATGLERLLLFPLVGGSLFLLATGAINTLQWYPWAFNFPKAHYAAAWITVGALIAHVGSKASVSWRTLRHGDPSGGGLTARAEPADRRWFLGGIAVAAGAVTVATVGQTLRPFRALSVLAPRDPEVGPQGFPVNRTAARAGITDEATGAGYRLRVTGRVGTPLSLTLADLQALPQRTATLPIACVEGWSASVTWTGVSLRDVLAAAEAEADHDLTIGSLQTRGNYATSTVTAHLAQDPDTLLALQVDGEALHPDHGYPVRLIAPNRPGVMQTKWVDQVVV